MTDILRRVLGDALLFGTKKTGQLMVQNDHWFDLGNFLLTVLPVFFIAYGGLIMEDHQILGWLMAFAVPFLIETLVHGLTE